MARQAPPRHHENEDEKDPGGRSADRGLRGARAKDEKEAARWQYFEQCLSAEHLRAYLKRLPDFEDFDAEQKALAVAGTHVHAVWGARVSYRVAGARPR